MAKELYDLIIIGSGPAGFGCAIYSARYKMTTLVLGSLTESQASRAHLVQNYPGIKGISGFDLVQSMKSHAEECGAKVREELVRRVEKESSYFKVTAEKAYYAKAILLAMGTKRKTLNIPGEEKFRNRGISYCAVCDAPLFKGKAVAIAGCSDAAASSAELILQYASKVYFLCRAELKSAPTCVSKLKHSKKIEVLCGVNATEAFGDNFLKGVRLDNGKELAVEGLFVEIGGVPSSEIAMELKIDLDEAHSIIVNKQQETNVAGIYAAGDITKGIEGFRQIVTAVAEGALAAKSIYAYLNRSEPKAQWG